MDQQTNESGSSGPFLQLRRFAVDNGVAAADADRVLRALLKRLRQQSPRVSETLFYVAGLRVLSRFAQDQARRACASSAREWCDRANAVADALTPEARGRAQQHMQSLPDELRSIYRMLVLDRATYAEIAQRLGTSVESVREQVFRAKEILRGRLASLVT